MFHRDQHQLPSYRGVHLTEVYAKRELTVNSVFHISILLITKKINQFIL